MAGGRKLQAEMERTLKKVTEGVELFDEIWDKLYASTNQTQKEKYEGDLKKEIKKLQKVRDSIKIWVAGSDVRDKASLVEARKVIETRMERFKTCEKEMKTKAYSKEGLAQADKVDPEELARIECREWVQDSLRRITDQLESCEATIETYEGKKNKKKDQEEIEELKEKMSQHQWHIEKLEMVTRALDNEVIDPEEVNALREDIEYYVTSNHEPDFYIDDTTYDSLDLVNKLAEVGKGIAIAGTSDTKDDDSSVGSSDSGGGTTKKSSGTGAAGSKGAKPTKKGESAAIMKQNELLLQQQEERQRLILKQQEEQKKKKEMLRKQQELAPKMDSSMIPTSSTGATAIVNNNNNNNNNNSASVPAVVLSSNTSAGTSSIPVKTAADVVLSSSTSTTEKPSVPSFASTLLGNTITSSSLNASSDTDVPSTNSTTTTTTTTTGVTAAEIVRRASASTSGLPPPKPIATSSWGGATSTTAAMSNKSDEFGNSSLDYQQISRSGSASLTNNPSVAVVNNIGSNKQLPELHNNNNSNNNNNNIPSLGKTSTNENPVILDHYSTANGGIATNPRGSGGMIVPPITSLAQRTLLLEASLLSIPMLVDSEQPRNYRPTNPTQTPASFPKSPATRFESPQAFERLELDTLFFSFYNQPGTYQQYLSAKELKRRAWRFHKTYGTWFTRHEDPKVTTDAYEIGTFVYHDFDAAKQKIKANFQFDYDAMEDE